MEDNTKHIQMDVCQKVKRIAETALIEVYKDKPPMGKVYIDPDVKECKIPNATRGAQGSSIGMAKGSKIPIAKNSNIMRGYIWWTNLKDNGRYHEDRVDMDLSVACLDKNLNCVDQVSYYNQENNYARISGDIVNGGDFDGKGVAEFLDVDLEKAKEYGIRYVCVAVHSFTQQPLSQMEHAHFGFMEREKMMDGEIFEPSLEIVPILLVITLQV